MLLKYVGFEYSVLLFNVIVFAHSTLFKNKINPKRCKHGGEISGTGELDKRRMVVLQQCYEYHYSAM